MRREKPELILVYESESACRRRLGHSGLAPQSIAEISSYLAQSTDLASEFGAIEAACAMRGIRFVPVELDNVASLLNRPRAKSCLVWTLTDGIAYFHGSVSPALAWLAGLNVFGSDGSVFALCQDKFRSGNVLRALGLPAIKSGLARNGEWIVEPPASDTGYFVKPNLLGAKIGIWSDSRCRDTSAALDLSRRIHAAYGDDAVVQAYLEGRDVRASFLAVEPTADMDALGVCFVDHGGDFQTMEESLSLYGETGREARAAGAYHEPTLIPVAAIQPVADVAIRDIARRMAQGLGLRDVFSIDLRVAADGRVYLIEFEVSPGLPCFDFRDYCRRQWNLTLAEAMAEAAARRLVP
jgi:D-alanine-D-alanine ligase-like ATP-grasp enzyme